jgi:hypothetical protein
MSSIIDGAILPQAYEVIRDRIGRILTEELVSQFAITGDKDFDVTSWIERYLQFDNHELPAVNVMMGDGTFGGQTVIQTDGTYRFYIDVYVKAKSSQDDPGDQRAMLKLHRLLGKCRAIIEDARYKTLAFTTPPGFIMNRHFETIQIQNPNQKEHDATSSVMGRLVLSVKAPEITAYTQPRTLRSFQTAVKLHGTDKGYLWTMINDPYYFDNSFDKYFF